MDCVFRWGGRGAGVCVFRWAGGANGRSGCLGQDMDQQGSMSLTLTCYIDRPADLSGTILPHVDK